VRLAVVLSSVVVLLGPSAGWTQTVRISSAGSQPSISGSGRFVVFTSHLTPVQHRLVMLHDRDTDADGVFDEADAIQTTRLSLRADGGMPNGDSHHPSITADGRFVVFLSRATDLIPGVTLPDHAGLGDFHVYRVERATGQTILVSVSDAGEPANAESESASVSDDGRYVVFVSAATNLGGTVGAGPAIFLRDIEGSSTVQISDPLPPPTCIHYIDSLLGCVTEWWSVSAPSLSTDGSTAAFSLVRSLSSPSDFGPGSTTSTGSIHVVSTGSPRAARIVGSGLSVLLPHDGKSFITLDQSGAADWTHIETATTSRIAVGVSEVLAWSRDARSLVLRLGVAPFVFDLSFNRSWQGPLGGDSISSDGRYLAFDSSSPGHVFVTDLVAFFDGDADTLDDRWETFYGLSTSSAAGADSADGPGGDPDDDGATNAQEQIAGTHPRGTSQRQLAEGAGGPFFHTQYDVFNPSSSQRVTATLVFGRPDGLTVSRPLALEPSQLQSLSSTLVPGLSGEFSTILESDAPLIVERTMTWPRGERYGSHAETGTATPSATWYLAEGSTVADFELFYLLQNPHGAAVTATVRFLRPTGAPIERTYDLAPHSRLTIHVNDVPGLADSDVAAAVDATQPIVAERAMYASRAGQTFALGHGGLGAPRLSTTWYLAEGATGPFFDAYVIVANPSPSPAAVSVRFLKDDGTTVTREVTVAAERRVSLFVDAIAGLEHSSFATIVTSTNDVPVVVERAMYWPGGFYDYYEGHSSVGVTAPATRWATAGGWEGGFEDARTYLLIANVSEAPGQVLIRALPQGAGPRDLVIDVAPNGRATVPLRSVLIPEEVSPGRRFPVVVESLGETPVPIVVERATYTTVNGVVWAAGANAFATPVP
jgi:hypothetical protein